MPKFEATVCLRIKVPLAGNIDDGREAVDIAEQTLASAYLTRGRDAILSAREAHAKAEAAHLEVRADQARRAETEAVQKLLTKLKSFEVVEAIVEQVEETA